ncbi:MAG: hypothetical protein KAU95_04515, partial [Candidatus Aenigmarchaeota archaeon]|nr:hypothetical protein [Candidatus Aenigmarchaeota archaeon]
MDDYTESEFKKSCGSGSSCGVWSNYCDGDDVYRSRDCIDKGCSLGYCYENSYTETEFLESCPSGSCGEWCYNYCSGSDVYHSRDCYNGCSGGSCSIVTETEFKGSCGSDTSCSDWGSDYCSGSSVYHSRTCQDKGCLAGGCYDNPYTEEESVGDCDGESYTDYHGEYSCCSGTNLCTCEDWDYYQGYCSLASCETSLDSSGTDYRSCAADASCTGSCSCGSWAAGSCGGGSCSDTQRQSTRTCTPSGCDSESKCEADASCGTITCSSNSDCNDGNSCTQDVCHSPGTTSSFCSNNPYCSGTDTSCGCASCTNCNNNDGWYNSGSSYACCSGNSKCTCQAQKYRNYYCSGNSCTYSVTNTRTVKSNCQNCCNNEVLATDDDGGNGDNPSAT